MTDAKLRAAVLAKLKVTPQRISQRIQLMRHKVPMSTQDGWYVIAALEKIDISKYLDASTVDKIRGLVREVRGIDSIVVTKREKSVRRATSPDNPRTITILPNISLTDPLISSIVASEAKLMAERVYPLVYLLENSMRAFIVRVMQAAHGKNWWDAKVPASVQNPVANRLKKEERLTWHGKLGAHPIYYSDTPHLIEIVEANWKAFSAFLPKKEFFTERLWEINHSRRAIAHNNPLASDDRNRLEVYFKDWQKHVASISPSLP